MIFPKGNMGDEYLMLVLTNGMLFHNIKGYKCLLRNRGFDWLLHHIIVYFLQQYKSKLNITQLIRVYNCLFGFTTRFRQNIITKRINIAETGTQQYNGSDSVLFFLYDFEQFQIYIIFQHVNFYLLSK